MLIEHWRRHYNAVRPHFSLGYRPPAPETILPPASSLTYAALRPAQTLATTGRVLLNPRYRDKGQASHVHGDARIYTFWHYMRNRWPRDAGLRLDHIMLSPALSDELASAGVDRAVRGQPVASDHAPVWITLRRHARH